MPVVLLSKTGDSTEEPISMLMMCPVPMTQDTWEQSFAAHGCFWPLGTCYFQSRSAKPSRAG